MGTRRWGHVPADAESISTTESLLLDGRPSAAAQLSLFRAFERWRGSNPHLPKSIGEVLAIFGGYLFEHDLKASTCANYVRTALFFCRRTHVGATDAQWFLAYDILRGLDRHACRQPRDHAIDIDENRALEILNAIRMQDIAFTIWLMLMSGARCADLASLAPEQVVLRESRLYIHFRETKSVQRPADQYSVELEV